MSSSDRNSFDTATSGTVQGDIGSIIGRLEAVMGERDSQVSAAMSDFQADGVSEEYHAVEQRWRRASHEVRTIIHLVRSTLANNDETAMATQGRARNAVQNIG